MFHPTNIDFNKLAPWAKKLIQDFDNRVCNIFIMSGNIGDYGRDNVRFEDYLVYLLSQVCMFDQVFMYDPICFGTRPFVNTDSKQELFDIEQMKGRPIYDNFLKDVMMKRPKNLLLEDMRRYNYNALIVKVTDTPKGWLHTVFTSKEFFRSRSMVIILTDNMYSLLRDSVFSLGVKKECIYVPLPDYEARLRLITGCHMLAERRPKGYSSELNDEELAVVTAGLNLQQIEDLILECSSEHPITRQSAIQKKASIISSEYSSIIELMDPGSLTLDSFAGQEGIKQYFKEVVIDAIVNQNLSIVPKGVLLMGPPGTGKSFFAKCLAGSAGINCVNFKMSKILDKYVGVAEQRLDQAFSVFHAMAPVIVFIDEMDQAIPRGSGSDGPQVYANIFGSFLAELSKPENRGKIIWLGATNYPNKIDEALKRTGRFDKKIPFFAPTVNERAEVLAKHLKKAGNDVSAIDCHRFAMQTDGYTQAEIEGVVVKALELASRRGQSVTNELLDLAQEYMVHAYNSKIREMENIALLECNDLEFVSAEYRERRAQLAEKIALRT